MARSLNAHGQRIDGESETFVVLDPNGVAGSISGGAHPGGHNGQDDAQVIVGGGSWPTIGDDSPSLTGRRGDQTAVVGGASVRRLTPTECERLQGFPDGWTFGPDSARYRQLGNAVCVPVAEWLGHRIAAVEATRKEHAA